MGQSARAKVTAGVIQCNSTEVTCARAEFGQLDLSLMYMNSQAKAKYNFSVCYSLWIHVIIHIMKCIL